MAVGLINGVFQPVDTAGTQKRFQVDTGGTLTTNLIEFWKLQEMGAGVNRRGELNKIVLSATNMLANSGKTGWAAEFTSNSYLQQLDSTLFVAGNNDFSWSAWVYFDASGSNEWILNKWNSSGNQRSFTMLKNTSDQIQWAVSWDGTNSATATETGTTLSTGTWYHVVGIHDAAGDVNKVVVNDTTPTTAANTGGCYDSTEEFRMGEDGAGLNDMNGRICDVGYWDKALSAQEITDLYNSGNGNTLI